MGEKLAGTLDGHLVVQCPACGKAQDRTQRYFHVLGAKGIRAIVLLLVTGILGVILYTLARNLR